MASKKKLPQPRKNFKDFMLDEDAKVIDKSTSKIAILGTFIIANIIANSEESYAGNPFKSHTNKVKHGNETNLGGYDTNTPDMTTNTEGKQEPIHPGFLPWPDDGDSPGHEIVSYHGNDFVHGDNTSLSGLGAVLAGALLGAITGGVGWAISASALVGGAGIGAVSGGILGDITGLTDNSASADPSVDSEDVQEISTEITEHQDE